MHDHIWKMLRLGAGKPKLSNFLRTKCLAFYQLNLHLSFCDALCLFFPFLFLCKLSELWLRPNKQGLFLTNTFKKTCCIKSLWNIAIHIYGFPLYVSFYSAIFFLSFIVRPLNRFVRIVCSTECPIWYWIDALNWCSEKWSVLKC